MKFQLACGDVMPGCPTTFSESNRDALVRAVSAHAAQEHGITEITPEIAEAVSAQIRQVD